MRVARLAEMSDGLPLGVVLEDGRRVCLVRDGDMVYAIEDKCSHRDFAISGGDVVRPCVIECPWHGARFDARTGAVLTGPATDDLPTYVVRIDGAAVFVGPLRPS